MIARTYETKVLGIIIQANLKWNTHIIQLKKSQNREELLIRLKAYKQMHTSKCSRLCDITISNLQLY